MSSEIRRVLLAEDDPSVAEYLEAALRVLGLRVELVTDGRAAVERALALPPDLILLDALLPRLDGFQALETIRMAKPDLPIIIMSGVYTRREYVIRARELGANDFLTKPLSVLDLWDLVRRHLPGPAPGPTAETAETTGVPLTTKPLVAVAAELRRKRENGLLFVRGPSGSALLFVENGRPIFGRSDDPNTRLDRVLRDLGGLQGVDDRALGELWRRSNGRRIGELMVQEGWITRSQLDVALKRQQGLHLTRPFCWSEGSSHFFHSDAPQHESFKLELDLDEILVSSCRQLPVSSQLAILPPARRRVRLSEDFASRAQAWGFRREELDFMASVDGSLSIAQLRTLGRAAQVEVEALLACARLFDALEDLDDLPEVPRRELPGYDVPTNASLAAVPAAAALLSLHLTGRSGVLQFTSSEPGHQLRACFDRGRLCWVQSSSPETRLGQVLLREGAVQLDALTRAVEHGRQQGVRLGRALLEQNAVDLHSLHGGLEAQVRHAVADLVRWRGGHFELLSREPDNDAVFLELDVTRLVLDALRSCPFTVLGDRLPPPEAVLRLARHAEELACLLPLEPSERRLVDDARHRTRLGPMLERSHEPEDLLRALHALLVLGLVQADCQDVDDAPEPTATPPTAAESTPVPIRDEAAAAPTLAIGPHDPAMTGDTLLPLDESPAFVLPDSSAPVSAVSEMASTATALLRDPQTDELSPNVAEFLANLGSLLETSPEAIPEELRRQLPKDVREKYGL
ncbi:MAG: DUF4388 domain-containing protein [Acidobacteriota bacterium]